MALTLGEVMTRNVKTMQADQVLLEAMQFLRQHSVRHVPVLQDGKLVGILTDRDIKRATPSALAPGQRELWEKVVKETPLTRVMTRDPMTATPEMTLEKGLRAFVDENIGCLPVLEGGQLVGIVTARDMFRAMLKILEA